MIGASMMKFHPYSAMALILAMLISSMLYPLFAIALGPITADVTRDDGLCALLVNPVGGYTCREYIVETDDQFLVGVQRMYKSAFAGKTKAPILLLHGILLGGDVWVLNPPDEAFAFILADQGYDVWIANTRTTRFSYGHVQYTKKDKGFWEWSVDELAQYDLPAMMGLVRSETNQKFHYVGYSQGSQQALIAFSQGQLLDMVSKVVFVAPVAYVNDVSAPIAQLAATFYVDRLYEFAHVYEFSTQFRTKEFVDIICRPKSLGCFNTFVSLFTGNNCCINGSRRAIIDTYETQPTSTKNLVHFAQQYRQQDFCKFDYGRMGNLMRYGQLQAPAYDMRKVAVDNTLFVHGGADTLSDPKDVAHLFALLPQQGQYPVYFVPKYAHLDFILGTDAYPLVYKPILHFLEC